MSSWHFDLTSYLIGYWVAPLSWGLGKALAVLWRELFR